MASIDVKLSAQDKVAVAAADIENCARSLDVFLKGTLDGISMKECYGMTLGYRVRKDGVIVYEFSYPPPGVTLIRSDQLYLCADRAPLIPNTAYDVECWIKKLGGEVEMSKYSFTSAKDPQPYASWTWDDKSKVWVAPKPYPEDGKNYIWDEKTLSWVVDEGGE